MGSRVVREMTDRTPSEKYRDDRKEAWEKLRLNPEDRTVRDYDKRCASERFSRLRPRKDGTKYWNRARYFPKPRKWKVPTHEDRKDAWKAGCDMCMRCGNWADHDGTGCDKVTCPCGYTWHFTASEKEWDALDKGYKDGDAARFLDANESRGHPHTAFLRGLDMLTEIRAVEATDELRNREYEEVARDAGLTYGAFSAACEFAACKSS